MTINRFLVYLVSISIIAISVSSCNKRLDKDGGYFDEETQTYKYVNPRSRHPSEADSLVSSPKPGEIQRVSGIISKIDQDAKSVWLQIEDRKPYMILVENLSTMNRDDKIKAFRIKLEYVSPTGSVVSNIKLRIQWKKYVSQVMAAELLDKSVVVDIKYLDKQRRYVGTVYLPVQTNKGKRIRNFNLWMVQTGLSFYFIDQGKAPNDKEYIQAQDLARKNKSGLWKYQ